MIRIAALDNVGAHADVLLLAGDLTRHGTLAEARGVAEEFGGLPIPVVAVLGNHDYHSDAQDDIASLLTDAGIAVLEGDGTVLRVDGHRLGSAFGEPEMKAFTAHTTEVSDRLGRALKGLDADLRVALTHYAPVPDTLRGEPQEIYPFLGSYLLGEAIDAAETALAVHGHAHFGTEQGVTPGWRPGAQCRPTGDQGRLLGVLHWGVAGNYLRGSSNLGVSERHFAS